MKAVEVRNIKIGEGIPKICVPIVGVTKEDIINEAKTFENIPVDVVEWRVDWFENIFDIEKVKDVLTDLRQVLKDTPILFTFRTSKEGGEKAIEAADYAKLNKEIAATGNVDLVDVEAFTGDEVVKEIIEAAHACGVKVVASNHDFDKTPDKDDIGDASEQTGCIDTAFCNRRDEQTVCGQTDHYDVYGRYRCDQPSLR